MSTIPNALITRLEIVLYSALTSLIGDMHRIRAHFGHSINDPSQLTSSNSVEYTPLIDQFPAKPAIKRSIYFSQVLLSVLIWITLGFSAGFLIGMLNTR